MENVLSFYEKVWDEINDNLKNIDSIENKNGYPAIKRPCNFRQWGKMYMGNIMDKILTLKNDDREIYASYIINAICGEYENLYQYTRHVCGIFLFCKASEKPLNIDWLMTECENFLVMTFFLFERLGINVVSIIKKRKIEVVIPKEYDPDGIYEEALLKAYINDYEDAKAYFKEHPDELEAHLREWDEECIDPCIFKCEEDDTVLNLYLSRKNGTNIVAPTMLSDNEAGKRKCKKDEKGIASASMRYDVIRALLKASGWKGANSTKIAEFMGWLTGYNKQYFRTYILTGEKRTESKIKEDNDLISEKFKDIGMKYDKGKIKND